MNMQEFRICINILNILKHCQRICGDFIFTAVCRVMDGTGAARPEGVGCGSLGVTGGAVATSLGAFSLVASEKWTEFGGASIVAFP
jgi:hypothetical protein